MKPTYEELEQQLSESRREFWAADATINNLEMKLAEMAAQLANAENKCEALAAENAGLYARAPVAYSYRYAVCETCDGFQDWRWELSKEKPPEWMIETGKVTNLVELFELPETTATDAFLAEVRAQGVEMFAASLKVVGVCGHPYLDAARDLAAKLRNEASSAMLQASVPETDNTNQQFESLSRGDK